MTNYILKEIKSFFKAEKKHPSKLDKKKNKPISLSASENDSRKVEHTGHEISSSDLVASKKRHSPVLKATLLSRREEIPKHEKVLTSQGGGVEISDDLKVEYIALLTSEESGSVIILCEQSLAEKRVDNNFLYVVESCKNAGYKSFKKYYATSDIIKIIYESSTKKTKAERKEQKDSIQGKVYDLIGEALHVGSSDIHIEVRNTHAQIRFRVNSKLSTVHEWPIDETRLFSGLIYRVIAKEKDVTFNEKEQQSAIIDIVVNTIPVRIRLNTMPAYPGGFDMVMRVLRMGSSTGNVDMTSLGYAPDQIEDLKKMIARPTGVIIIAGVTGSGKSTTNSVMLKGVIDNEMTPSGCGIKVITVEDPPEYEILHTTQVPVNSNQKMDSGKSPFAAAMKAALRCDPDILMVGEVRDNQSSDLLVHAVQSGHQVYTTLHAQSAFSIIPRLSGIGVDKSVIGTAGFISGLVYQSLLPLTCKDCALSFNEYESQSKSPDKVGLLERVSDLSSNGYGDNIVFRNKDGCKNCKNGIVGMTVVAETVVPDEDMCELFAEGRTNEARRLYRMDGGKFIVDHGIDKVREGLCCPEDAEKRLGPLIPSSFYADQDLKKSRPKPNGSIKKTDPIKPRSEHRKKNQAEDQGESEYQSPDLKKDLSSAEILRLNEKK
jgi:type II secretory ATPase GspE/PulE/Tfp pilus assembly ATPase PilB-like protein